MNVFLFRFTKGLSDGRIFGSSDYHCDCACHATVFVDVHFAGEPDGNRTGIRTRVLVPVDVGKDKELFLGGRPNKDTTPGIREWPVRGNTDRPDVRRRKRQNVRIVVNFGNSTSSVDGSSCCVCVFVLIEAPPPTNSGIVSVLVFGFLFLVKEILPRKSCPVLDKESISSGSERSKERHVLPFGRIVFEIQIQSGSIWLSHVCVCLDSIAEKE